MLLRLPFLFLLSLSWCAAASSSGLPRQVIMIRHGEKGDEPVNLNPAGYKRADCLVDYFMHPKAGYNVPDYIIAMAQHDEDSGNRPVETVTPLATALNMSIDDSWKKGDETDAADSILNDHPGETVLVCWEHKALVDLAADLGACTNDGSFNWGLNPEASADNPDCYNAVWVVDYPTDDVRRPRLRAITAKKIDIPFTVYAQFDVIQNGNNFECVFTTDPTEVFYMNECVFKP